MCFITPYMCTSGHSGLRYQQLNLRKHSDQNVQTLGAVRRDFGTRILYVSSLEVSKNKFSWRISTITWGYE